MNLKELRQKHALTQSQLAEKVGLTKQTIINYEKDGVPDSKIPLFEKIFVKPKNLTQEFLLSVEKCTHSDILKSLWFQRENEIKEVERTYLQIFKSRIDGLANG